MADLNIDKLCDDVLLEIFSYVSVKDLARNVQYVCCRWRELYLSSVLWKRIEYRPEHDDQTEEVLEILKQAPYLRYIKFDRILVDPRMIKTIANNRSIVKLELMEFEAFTHQLLRTFQENCPLLEHLTLEETIFHDIKMGEIIGDFHNLKSLIILRDPYASESLIKIKPLAEGCPKLERLDIRSKIAKNEELGYLLFKKKDKLKHLGILCWTEDGHCTLPLIPICTQLNTLHISYVCRSSIIERLHFKNCLTSFSWTHLGTTNLTQILEIFRSKSLCQLKELSISRYTNYEDILLNTIVQYCPFLKKLHLSECWNLTDESLKNLHVLRNLQSVDFCASKVTDYGITFLVLCEQLQYIDLSCCRHLTGRVLLLLARLRNLQVLILDGCSIQGISMEVLQTHFHALTKLSLRCCYGIRKADLDRLRNITPLVKLDQ